MKHGGMGTYFFVGLTQFPDTPPKSGGKMPSQRWRSVQWNRPVHIDHILDSKTGQCGSAGCLARPSQVVNPPNLTWDECVCSYLLYPLIKPAYTLALQQKQWKLLLHSHKPSFPFPYSNATAAPLACVSQGASNLPASLSVRHNLCFRK